MNIIATVTFPDGTTAVDPNGSGHMWTVSAPPITAEAIEKLESESIDEDRVSVDNLERAMSDGIAAIDPKVQSADNEVASFRVARLGSSTATVFVDNDGDVIDIFGNPTVGGPLFPKTHEPLLDALIAEAHRQIDQIRESVATRAEYLANLESDHRLVWSVLRWMKDEASATAFAARINRENRRMVQVIEARSSEPVVGQKPTDF